MHTNDREEYVYGPEDDIGWEFNACVIADNLSNPEGALKISMKPHEVFNLLSFLLEEVPSTNYKKLSLEARIEIMRLDVEGYTPAEIRIITGHSKTMIKDYLINIKYNALLSRAQDASEALRATTKPEWRESCH